jgi:protein associated with RNAse G/E
VSATVTVRAYKFDGSEHRQWPAEIVRQDESLLVLQATFQEQVEHQLLGTIPCGTLSVEYYWFDRWYNVFRFHELNGDVRNYYCNVNIPPEFDGQNLKYVDLDIDVLVRTDLSYEVLDLRDFQENAVRYGYPSEIREQAHNAVIELQGLIRSRSFPFNDLRKPE